VRRALYLASISPRCDVPAAAATVTKDTPNKGREYWHCKVRVRV
jgi:hypothetical protein